jgi:hypothetical protein
LRLEFSPAILIQPSRSLLRGRYSSGGPEGYNKISL